MGEQPLILVVDDEENFREIFGARLSAEGLRIETAQNGKEALEKVKIMKPDLILMDVQMPVMDGASAVLKLREDPGTKDIKVAFLTSLGDPNREILETSKKFSAEIGAQAYLKKTDDLDMLVEEIKKLISF